MDHARLDRGRFALWDYLRGGFFSRPAMPEGAFSISYKNGLRAIIVGSPNEQDTRRYFGFPQIYRRRHLCPIERRTNRFSSL